MVETDDGRFDVYLLETYGVPDKAKRVGSERDPLYADERFDVLVNTEIKRAPRKCLVCGCGCAGKANP